MAPTPQRSATEADAIAGMAPRLVYDPSTRQECAEIFQAARAGGLALAVVGGGTELGLGAPPARLDAVVCSRRLDRVVEFAPSDQVVRVEAGMTLASLQQALAKSAQRLACDPPLGERATIGGLLATNGFGPLRARFGSLRDLVIGISILRADGTEARGGGKVVKNVAGFDLPKLMVGALGTLGMIVTATFRLHPLPEVATTVLLRGLAPGELRPLLLRMRAERVEPAALAVMSSGAGYDALLRFEGFSAGVRQQCARAGAGLEHDADELSAGQAVAAWAAHDARRTAGNARMKLSMPPSALPTVASDVLPALAGVLSGAAVIGYPTLGLWFVAGYVDDAAALARAVDGARAALAGMKGWLVVQDLPLSARPRIDVWGPPPPALPLMRRLKERFDPENRLNPGRFVGGL